MFIVVVLFLVIIVMILKMFYDFIKIKKITKYLEKNMPKNEVVLKINRNTYLTKLSITKTWSITETGVRERIMPPLRITSDLLFNHQESIKNFKKYEREIRKAFEFEKIKKKRF